MGNSRSGKAGRLLMAVALVVTAAACSTSQSEETTAAAAVSPPFQPTIPIQDVMLELIDPAADAFWDSVATIITAEGIEDKRPETDDEWAALRNHAVTLVEASNVLMIEGRHVAREGFESENPGIELEPEEVQALIDGDRASWWMYARGLHDAAAELLDAAETKNVEEVFDGGEVLDEACENCHRHYWYPNDPGPITAPAD